MDILSGLNEAQKRAVLHKEGPLIVLAGAGAGKTRAIVHKIAHLIYNGLKPEEILAVTFTNKAAQEMKERVRSLLGDSAERQPFVSTFHSLGVHILRHSGRPLGIPRNFSILDKEDSLDVVKSVMKEIGLDPKQFQPAKMQSMISRMKGDLMVCEEFMDVSGGEFFPTTLANIWKKYEEELEKQKALDFDDLVAKTVLLLRNHVDARTYYQDLWKYILIDEYQDTNKSQYEFSKLLAQKHKNICIIGDMDQSIYAFRGADFRNIVNFERDYPEHTCIVFEENYRSTQTILEAAARVIEKNKMRKPKQLLSTRYKGEEISLFEAMTEQEEADFVVKKAKELMEQGIEPSQIAVLFRTNFQSRVLEESCLKKRLPYQMLGTQFYHRKEIKDILAYVKGALNPEDAVNIKRIINVPPRGIGKVGILNFFAKKKIPRASEERINEFLKLLESIKERINSSNASEAVKFAIKRSGMEEFLNTGSEEDRERLENLKELVTIATRYDGYNAPEGIEKMLTDAALMADQDTLDKKKNAVRLMTVHSAKGLEFDYVFIVGMEDGLFPHTGWGDNSADKQEEERRLFYVALTRAKEKLFLSYAATRMIFGSKQLNMPSRFFSDIPEHLIKLEDAERGLLDEYIRYD